MIDNLIFKIKNSDLSSDFFWRTTQIIVKNFVTFSIFFISARILNTSDFGIYNYLMTFLLIFIMFSDFGISTATSKYVTEYSYKNKQDIGKLIFNAVLLVSVLSSFLIIVFVLIKFLYLQDISLLTVLLSSPLILLIPLCSVFDGVYRGLGEFKLLSKVSVFVSLFMLVACSFAVILFGINGAILGQVILYIALLYFMYLYLPVDFRKEIDWYIFKEVAQYSFWYGIAIFGNYLFIKFGNLILGHYHHYDVVSIYEILSRIFLIVVLPFTLLGQVLAPKFTKMALNGEWKHINKYIKNYSFLFVLTGIILGTVLYFIIPYVLLFFLPQYNNVLFYQIFPFTTVIFIVNISTATIDAGIVVPVGLAKIMAMVYMILGTLSIFLSLYLYYLFGYMGIIYTFTISSILMLFILRIVIYVVIKSKG